MMAGSDGLEIVIDYRGPDGPAKEALRQRVREALTAAGMPYRPPGGSITASAAKPQLRVIRGDRQ